MIFAFLMLDDFSLFCIFIFFKELDLNPYLLDSLDTSYIFVFLFFRLFLLVFKPKLAFLLLLLLLAPFLSFYYC